MGIRNKKSKYWNKNILYFSNSNILKDRSDFTAVKCNTPKHVKWTELNNSLSMEKENLFP